MNRHESNPFVLRSIPESVTHDKDRFPETYKLIASAVGNSFHPRGRNNLGMIEIWIAQDGTDTSDPCADSVWIEPEFFAEPKTETPNKAADSRASRPESP